ncbi:MAG: Cof-type HAD-IIB family hydrolase [Pseudanabaenaceae cyanobacterium]
MAIRLLVLDLDGTVVGPTNEISPTVKAAVTAAQERGVRVAIATGRMYRSALRFHYDLGADCPLLSYQGALIQEPDPTNPAAPATPIAHWAVPKSQALRLIHQLKTYGNTFGVHLYIDDTLYVEEVTLRTETYAARSQVPVVAVGDFREFLPTANDPTKVLALSDQPEAISQLLLEMKEVFSPQELYLTKSQPTYFEATNPLAHKGNAVQFLAEEKLGLTAAEVMAVGDNMNDFEMVRYAGIGVAMGSAPPALQAVAQWVAPPVEADGAAAAIARFILDAA